MRLVLYICLILVLSSCHRQLSYDLQGHRGSRGIRPENTLPAFRKAINLGVTTLEMDLVISADSQVVVSHEPFFSHKISKDPNGNLITEANEKEHNIYRLRYNQVRLYDVGTRKHPDFPEQKKLKTYKPLFSEVLQLAERKTRNRKTPIRYNVEIKRHPDYDGVFHPDAAAFARLVLDVLRQNKVLDRTIIQSFDSESLEAVYRQEPKAQIAFLVANKETVSENLSKLSFTPAVYSPYFKMVDKEAVEACHARKIKIIPWTVNEKDDFISLLDLGVDGIITDYPNLAIKWSQSYTK